jgi:hypothetical protein
MQQFSTANFLQLLIMFDVTFDKGVAEESSLRSANLFSP